MPGTDYKREEVSSVLPKGKMPAGVKGKKRQAMKATYRKIDTNNAGTTKENRESGDKNFNK